VHAVIRRNARQVDSEVEAGGTLKHNGEHGFSRTNQVDGATYLGNKKPTGGPGQSESEPFEDVRPPAEGRAGMPWDAAFDDHLIPACPLLACTGAVSSDYNLSMLTLWVP